ncbi:sensor domain-containing diguanylate cyclase [Thiomicrorhabdus immobilis]|uniref:sensor domain-containing diguanylate cyclase n=1 Tax=Thiomicrorhabdus immobilis TaxID=2791037 RepID=UPI001F00A5A4|nr:diguanylate cyclase [Thiomicrorhabdus immobilis]
MTIILVATALYWLYATAKTQLYNDVLSAHYKTLDYDINRLVENRREASMAIALTLSENKQVRDFICEHCTPETQSRLNFDALLDELALHTHHSGIWIQILDHQGISRYRSWTDKVGDSLVNARRDVQTMLQTPQITQSMSVGKFSLTFKAMVPLLDENQQLIGIVEVVSHIAPLTVRLKEAQGVDSVILVDKRYRKQLTKAYTGLFVNDYYVANANASKSEMSYLETVASQRFSKMEPVWVDDNKVITQHPIQDDSGLVLGYWFLFAPEKNLDLVEMQQLKSRYLYTALVIMLLSLMLMLLYIFKKRSDISSSYYRTILDSASEIIFVSNLERILEANQQFFEFYSKFNSIDEFLRYYDCVCDTFEKQEGYLQREMEGVFWLEYVLKHPDDLHKVVIKKDSQTYYFQVKVAQIQLYETPLYSVIMHDITSQELYKKQLEFLSQTDTLTGISNRLVFNQTLVQEVQRSHRYHSDLSLLIFDIDFFKNINDSYGHEVGDQVLITLSEEVGKLLRETDVFCRIGGEEFTIIMPETNLHDAEQTAERLRKAIEELPQSTLPTQLTVSFGVAAMTRWDNDKTLLKRADQALYRAKENGRNRVEIAIELDNQAHLNFNKPIN